MPEAQKTRSRAHKHPIENYEHYTIFIISGISPVMFTAEKNDPSKGPTITSYDLDDLKQQIDKKLHYAATIHINTWGGSNNSMNLVNASVRIKTNTGFTNGFAIDITSDYDLDILIEMFENKSVRRSKKHNKPTQKTHLIRILYRNKTIEYE